MARDLLRFLTCGSVDDGKSTLIGRILFDSGVVPEDQLAALERDSRRFGTTGDALDVALLLDGLDAERQQGITIDVAYRYFSSPNRAFIVADTPGHEQFTRNMATGASNCDLAVILVDARHGLLVQTKRHSYICSLLGIRHVVLAINKMDLMAFSEEVFERISGAYQDFAAQLGFASITAIPLAARGGDNVVHRSAHTSWYQGPTMIEHLECVDVTGNASSLPFRFPVQYVLRPGLDFRGFAGTITSGRIAAGDRVAAAQTGKSSTVIRIVTADGDLDAAEAGQAVTLTLADEIDIARGDVLAPPAARPEVADQFAATLIWMDEEPLLPGRQYQIRIGHVWTTASISSIRSRTDVNTLETHDARSLGLNEIGVCHLSLAKQVPLDPYAENRGMGGFILVDRFTNRTVAAGLVRYGLRRASNIHHESTLVDKAARAALLGNTPLVLWFTGLSGSGKSTVAKLVEQALHQAGRATTMLDGDNLRHGLTRDLGFTVADRVENIRRVGEVAKLFTEAGVIVLCAFISPFAAERQMVREMLPKGEFAEIFVDTPIEACIARDPKGLYAKAIAGAIPNFTGISSPYEAPEHPELHLHTASTDPASLAEAVLDWLRTRGVAV